MLHNKFLPILGLPIQDTSTIAHNLPKRVSFYIRSTDIRIIISHMDGLPTLGLSVHGLSFISFYTHHEGFV